MFKGAPYNPSGWLTFNQFFARRLVPGLRPVDSPTDNTVVTSPADCTFKQTFFIAHDGGVADSESQHATTFTLKGTGKVGSVNQSIGDAALSFVRYSHVWICARSPQGIQVRQQVSVSLSSVDMLSV